jgi:hypothetical protein
LPALPEERRIFLRNMKLTKKQGKIVASAIHTWVGENVLSRDQGERLLESFEIAAFDWRRLAKYSFWVSICCIIIAVGAVVADDYLIALIAELFNAPAIAKCLGSASMATLFYYCGIRRKYKKPEKIFSNEAIFFLGVLATAASIAFFGEAMDTGSGHFSMLILIAAMVYGILGLWFPSKLVWVFSLISLGGWMGAETGYISGWGAYYLGMNYPLRFVLFGAVLTAASHALSRIPKISDFAGPTRAMGLLYLFISLWIMSIFGNYGDVDQWMEVRQIELFHWSLLFGLAAAAAIYHGIKADDGMTRGFGITFLFINLYTRFFEHFWNNMHKAIIFGLLAASFWYIGSHAEKIWNVSFITPPKKPDRPKLPTDGG